MIRPADPLPVDAIVLAAGTSSRTAPWHKLLAVGADGRSIIARTLANLRASRIRNIHVVLGHDGDRVADAMGGCLVRIIPCADHAAGLACSLRAGLQSLDATARAVLVCLGDMPLVTPTVIDRLIGAWQPGAIVAPVHHGRRGNPVLFDVGFVPEMLALSGDRGAASLLHVHAAMLHEVPCAEDGVLRDADTPGALRELPGGPWRAPDGTLI